MKYVSNTMFILCLSISATFLSKQTIFNNISSTKKIKYVRVRALIHITLFLFQSPPFSLHTHTYNVFNEVQNIRNSVLYFDYYYVINRITNIGRLSSNFFIVVVTGAERTFDFQLLLIHEICVQTQIFYNPSLNTMLDSISQLSIYLISVF